MKRVVKSIKGKEYLYEQRREGSKIVMNYIGPLDKIIAAYTNSARPSGSEAASAHPLAPCNGHRKAPALATLPEADLSKFGEWLLSRRGLDPKTAATVARYVQRQKFPVEPCTFMREYNAWLFKSFRLYVHYLYQLGIMGMEERMRWLEILKLKSSHEAKKFEVKEERVMELLGRRMPPGFGEALEICYYSGCRMTEAVRLLTAECPSEEIPGAAVRYALNWKRGKKRVEHVYLPASITVARQPGLDPYAISSFCRHKKLLQPKMLRKFFYRVAKSVALEHRADPQLADFYQSRVPRSIGEKHYGDMLTEADRLYPKVAAKLSTIRNTSRS